MCTVTFVPGSNGYRLGMNRDEKLSRVPALLPMRYERRGRVAVYPSEPSGGTWISLNDSGACLALINWYSVNASAGQNAVSRGEIIKSAAFADTFQLVEDVLSKLRMDRINPFRLIGIFPDKGIVEWQWDLQNLVCKKHSWIAQQWISSGFDEPMAQKIRNETFQNALQQKSAGRLDWLRRLHRSHGPKSGPFSTCMHREDAATVSYTEAIFSSHYITMRYHAGTPCNRFNYKVTENHRDKS